MHFISLLVRLLPVLLLRSFIDEALKLTHFYFIASRQPPISSLNVYALPAFMFYVYSKNGKGGSYAARLWSTLWSLASWNGLEAGRFLGTLAFWQVGVLSPPMLLVLCTPDPADPIPGSVGIGPACMGPDVILWLA
jgi:hypothetical protein